MRLLPPFETKDDFTIGLSKPGLFDIDVDVTPPEFLSHPKYFIRGKVDVSGKVHYRYEFNPIVGKGKRNATGVIGWDQIQEGSSDDAIKNSGAPRFGPFAFEIRGWDIAPNDTQEIAERFELKKASVRPTSAPIRGSPSTATGCWYFRSPRVSHDWLGLDLRRVGRVGPRLSTTQLVGYVAITAAENAHLEDTSDRERLASTPEVIAFEETLRAIVEKMEQERDKDRRDSNRELKFSTCLSS